MPLRSHVRRSRRPRRTRLLAPSQCICTDSNQFARVQPARVPLAFSSGFRNHRQLTCKKHHPTSNGHAPMAFRQALEDQLLQSARRPVAQHELRQCCTVSAPGSLADGASWIQQVVGRYGLGKALFPAMNHMHQPIAAGLTTGSSTSAMPTRGAPLRRVEGRRLPCLLCAAW